MSHALPAIRNIEDRFLRANPLPDFRSGDTVRVQVKIREGEKERLQAFEGVCIGRTRGGARATFTVRKISYGVGVERVFPEHSPNVASVDVVTRGKVRQARLFFLRNLSGKAARIKERVYDKAKEEAKKKEGRKRRGAHRKASAVASQEVPTAPKAKDKKAQRKEAKKAKAKAKAASQTTKKSESSDE